MTDYVRQLTTPGFPFEKVEAERLLAKFHTDAVVVDGIVRWKSNNGIPPKDVLDLWAYKELPFNLLKSSEVREAEQQAFLAEYRKNQAGKPVDPEQLAEMRAAFGPGEVVIDVFTGRRTQL